MQKRYRVRVAPAVSALRSPLLSRGAKMGSLGECALSDNRL